MSSVSIAGDTSGSILLAAPSVAGSSTLTLPTTGGTVLSDKTSGAVLQVQTAITTSSFAGGSGNGTTVLEVSITPKYSTSKMMIQWSGGFIDNVAGGNDALVLIKRGGSSGTLIALASGSYTQYVWSSARVQIAIGGVVTDSPGSASAQTYGFYFKNSTGSCNLYGCCLTVTEIAA